MHVFNTLAVQAATLRTHFKNTFETYRFAQYHIQKILGFLQPKGSALVM